MIALGHRTAQRVQVAVIPNDLVAELSMQSEDFRVRWASHDVRESGSGTQPSHHRLAGDLTLSYEALQLTADIGLTLIVYTAEPDSPSQEALNGLANWAEAEAIDPPGDEPRGRPVPETRRAEAGCTERSDRERPRETSSGLATVLRSSGPGRMVRRR